MHPTTQQATILVKRIERPRLHVKYPKVSGLSNPFAQQKINQTIQDLLFTMIKDQGFTNPQTEITATYHVRVNKNGILSLSFEVYAYTAMAAHGTTVMKSLTFNLETGKVYLFPDLFKEGSNYPALINAKIKQDIRDKQIQLISPFQSIAPNQEYYLTEHALVVYFQLYEFTPYAYGIPEFPISYTLLRNTINPYGPIPKVMTP